MIYFTDREYKKFDPAPMELEDFFNIAQKLGEYHSVFSQIWRMGVPIMATEYNSHVIRTAEVHFDNETYKAKGIYINPNLWNRLTEKQRLFVFCHEVCHVIFNFGFRVQSLQNKNNANIAADTAINQILESNFFFNRKEIDPYNELCWHDAGIFKNIPFVEALQTMEYYYNLLNEESENDFIFENLGKNFFLGNHDNISDKESESVEDFCKDLNNKFSGEEKEEIKDLILNNFKTKSEYLIRDNKPGSGAGDIWEFIGTEKIKKNKKWESIIKKWATKTISNYYKNSYQWVITNRRFALLPKNLIIPTENETNTLSDKKNRIKVWFFQDTSSSCWPHRTRFFKASESLPKKRFDVKFHCFDTKIYESSLIEKKIAGGSGTRFDIIEEYIIANCNNKYPKAVFVLTDGWGNMVKPKQPGNWYIFLTTNSTYCFPKKCNFFNLDDYE